VRAGIYRSWQWLALSAAVWFAAESGLQVAFGEPQAALVAGGMCLMAAASVAIARSRSSVLTRPG
jgi:hypothetical protein